MNAKDWVKRARDAGASIKLHGGEVILSAEGVRPVRISHPTRRKDASKALEVWVRRLERREA